MQDSRPRNLTLGVKFCEESEFQVKNPQDLRPEAIFLTGLFGPFKGL